MKKIFQAILLLACMPIVAWGQQFGDEDTGDAFSSIEGRHWTLSLGPKVGGTFSTMTEADDFKLEPKTGSGFTAGVVVDARFGRRIESGAYGKTSWFGVQMEALFTQRNIKTNSSDLELSYLEVPVLFQFYPIPVMYVEAGVTIDMLMSSKPDYLSSGEHNLINTGNLGGGDMMPTVGLGIKLNKGFMADVRYQFGTSDLAGNFPCKTSMLSVSVGWMFDILK